MSIEQHEQLVDELQTENARLRDELHEAESRLTAIRAIVTSGDGR